MNKKFLLIGIILVLALSIASCFARTPAQTPLPAQENKFTPPPNFVTVSNGKFMLEGHPYYFVGTNFWQGMNLGVDGLKGDRALLAAELDRLQRIGVTNLRVMAASEGPNTEPHRMVPALMISPGKYDEKVLDGLDFFLSEVGKHNMKAVMVLNNYWQWSGGMAQYVAWSEGTPIPYPGDWGVFMNYSAKF